MWGVAGVSRGRNRGAGDEECCFQQAGNGTGEGDGAHQPARLITAHNEAGHQLKYNDQGSTFGAYKPSGHSDCKTSIDDPLRSDPRPCDPPTVRGERTGCSRGAGRAARRWRSSSAWCRVAGVRATTRSCTCATCTGGYRACRRNACPSYFPTVGRPRGRPMFQRTHTRPNNLERPSSSGDRSIEPSSPREGAGKWFRSTLEGAP
jgi:hypothetical protein